MNKYPVRTGPKRPENTNNDLVNERVRFPEVLVIGEDGAQLGRMSSREAYHLAVERELDLFCIAPNGKPPVCKIINYSKFKFEEQKKEKANKKKQRHIEIKEVQLTPQIADHDLQTKVRFAKKFLEEGNKVKVGVRYRGRQLAHLEVGVEVMNKFIECVSEFSTIEKKPSMDGRILNAVLASKVKK